MKSIFAEIIDDKSLKSFIVPLLVILTVYLIHLLYFAPFWPFDHDTFNKLLFINKDFEFEIRNHHHLRWGSYIIYKISSFFIDQNFVTITITSFIIFVFSILIFTYCVHINLGLLYSVMFVIFWITNKSINLEIFSFSVVNQTLLALSILFFYLQRLKTSNLSILHAFLLGLILFWIYGIKETNIFFFPLLLFFKIFRKNLLFVLKVVVIIIILYALESIFINYLSLDQNFIFGRIASLLSGETEHKDIMIGLTYEGIDTYFEKFFLIFYRWYSARDWDTTIFYFSFLLSIYFLFSKEDDDIIKNNFSIINSLLILSFFLFNTFFLISLFPPILGQPFNTRFLTILLPFSFISVIIFLKIIIDKSSHNFLSFLLICIVLLTFFSRPVYSLLKIDEDWGYLSLLSHKDNSVWDRYEQFDKLYNDIDHYDCLIINSKNPWVYLILEGMPLFLNKNINMKNFTYDDNLIQNNSTKNCHNKIIIKENGIFYN